MTMTSKQLDLLLPIITAYLNEAFPDISAQLKQKTNELMNPIALISVKELLEFINNRTWDSIISRIELYKQTKINESQNNQMVDSALFKVFECKISDLLAEDDGQIDAIRVLRHEMTTLQNISPQRLASLTQKIFQGRSFCDPSELDLFDQLKSLPGFLYSADRLVELVSQAEKYQIMQCPYHIQMDYNFDPWIDHKCLQSKPLLLDPHLDLEYIKIFTENSSEHLLNIFSNKDFSKIVVSDDLGRLFDLNRSEFSLEARDENLPESCSIWPHEFGKVPLCNGGDAGIQIRDLFNGLLALDVEDLGEIISWAFTFDNRYLIASSENQITFLIDLESGKIVHSWIRLRCTFLLTSSEPNADYFLAIQDDGSILQVSILSPFQVIKRIPNLKNSKSEVSSAYLDNERLLLGFNDSSLYYFSNWKEYPEPTRIFRGHKCTKFKISAILSRFNRNLLISCSENGSIYIWNIESGRLIYEIPFHNAPVNDLIELEDSKTFLSCGDDKKLIEWKLK